MAPLRGLQAVPGAKCPWCQMSLSQEGVPQGGCPGCHKNRVATSASCHKTELPQVPVATKPSCHKSKDEKDRVATKPKSLNFFAGLLPPERSLYFPCASAFNPGASANFPEVPKTFLPSLRPQISLKLSCLALHPGRSLKLSCPALDPHP